MSAVEAPAGVDPETGEIEKSTTVDSRPVVLFTVEEAEAHTAKITATAAVLCLLVKEAHEKQAWKALGYTSWAGYVDERFVGKVSRSRSYQLIAQASVIEGLSEATGAEVSTVVDTFPEGRIRGLTAGAVTALVRQAIMDLPPEATTADRLAVADETVHRLAVTLSTKKASKPKPSAGAPPLPPSDASADPPPAEPVAPGDDAVDAAEGGADTAAPVPSAASSPIEARRKVVSDRAKAMRSFLSLDANEIAIVIATEDWATYLSLADELEQYAADLRAALTPQIGAVK